MSDEDKLKPKVNRRNTTPPIKKIGCYSAPRLRFMNDAEAAGFKPFKELMKVANMALEEFANGHPDDRSTYFGVYARSIETISSYMVPKMKAVEIKAEVTNINEHETEIENLKEKLKAVYEATKRS